MEVKKEVNKKTLYDYQQEDLRKIFKHLDELPEGTNILYQLPTGGGKTVVFSEITRRFIQNTGK
ncbi:MAG: DEAD/DEAH box helicase, partial [Flavobacteriia bacterium]